MSRYYHRVEILRPWEKAYREVKDVAKWLLDNNPSMTNEEMLEEVRKISQGVDG